jgi:hypothetical protein
MTMARKIGGDCARSWALPVARLGRIGGGVFTAIEASAAIE